MVVACLLEGRLQGLDDVRAAHAALQRASQSARKENGVAGDVLADAVVATGLFHLP